MADEHACDTYPDEGPFGKGKAFGQTQQDISADFDHEQTCKEPGDASKAFMTMEIDDNTQ